MTISTTVTLLQEALSLQAEIGLPPAVRVERRTGERLPAIARRPIWQLGPALDRAELARFAAGQPRLGPELVELYAAVGDGFRVPGIELPPVARVLELLAAAGSQPALVTLCPNHPPVVVAIEPDGTCELRRLEDDDDDDDETERWSSLGPMADALERLLRWPVEELRQRRSERRTIEHALAALDLSRVATPDELLAQFWTASRARSTGLPALMALADRPLRELVERVRPEQLSRDAARAIVGQLAGFALHDLLALFGEKCEHLFPTDNRASLPHLAWIAIAYVHTRRARAVPVLEACIRLGQPILCWQIALYHWLTGDVAEAAASVAGHERDDTSLGQDILGCVEAAAGRSVEAEAAFRRAISIHGVHARPIVHLGALLLRQGRLDDAEALLLGERVGATDTGNIALGLQPAYYRLLGELFDRRGDAATAATARTRIDQLEQLAQEVPAVSVTLLDW